MATKVALRSRSETLGGGVGIRKTSKIATGSRALANKNIQLGQRIGLGKADFRRKDPHARQVGLKLRRARQKRAERALKAL